MSSSSIALVDKGGVALIKGRVCGVGVLSSGGM